MAGIAFPPSSRGSNAHWIQRTQITKWVGKGTTSTPSGMCQRVRSSSTLAVSYDCGRWGWASPQVTHLFAPHAIILTLQTCPVTWCVWCVCMSAVYFIKPPERQFAPQLWRASLRFRRTVGIRLLRATFVGSKRWFVCHFIFQPSLRKVSFWSEGLFV